MTDTNVDLVVLGGGTAGYAAAIRAAELGSKVVLVEKGKLGGTCLHRGCIPTKTLLHAAEVADEIKEAAAVGLNATFDGVDIEGLHKYKDGIVSRHWKGLQGIVKSHGITVVEGEGRFEAPTSVVVGDDRYVGTDVVLATGSYSRSLPGLEITGRVITSEQALGLQWIPQKALVLGGGVIGVEFASIWASLGAEVTIIEALPSLAPAEDPWVGKQLERAFRKRKIGFKTGVRFSGVTQDDSGVTVTLESGESLQADLLLVAVGRGAATAGNGFEEAGVTLDRGFVITDERLRHQPAARVRDRRHRAGPAAGAPRLPAGHLRRRGDHRDSTRSSSRTSRSPGSPTATRRSPPSGSPRRRPPTELGADSVETYVYNLGGNGKSDILRTSRRHQGRPREERSGARVPHGRRPNRGTDR